MQHLETLSLLEKENSFKIYANLDVDISNYLSKLLFEYVEKGEINFGLKSKSGSIVSEILINITGGVFSVILYDLIKKLYLRLKQERKNGKTIKSVDFFTLSKHYIITGNEEDEILEKIREELFR